MRFCTFIILALTSCATVRSAPSRLHAQDYFNWTLGTRLTYRASLLGADRALVVTLEKREPDGAFVDSTGARRYRDAAGVRDVKRYLLQEPIVAGATWQNIVSVSSVERYVIADSGSDCEAAAGHWKACVTVEARNRIREGTELVNRYTLAPGVGIVKLQTTLEDGTQKTPQSHMELVRIDVPTSAN